MSRNLISVGNLVGIVKETKKIEVGCIGPSSLSIEEAEELIEDLKTAINKIRSNDLSTRVDYTELELGDLYTEEIMFNGISYYGIFRIYRKGLFGETIGLFPYSVSGRTDAIAFMDSKRKRTG